MKKLTLPLIIGFFALSIPLGTAFSQENNTSQPKSCGSGCCGGNETALLETQSQTKSDSNLR